jgi:WD40 repeat protein
LWRISELLGRVQARPHAELFSELPTEVTTLAFTADGQWLAAGCRDGRIGVTSLAGGTARTTVVPGHRKNTIVSGLSALNDGSLLTSGLDGMLLRWTLTTGTTAEPAALRSTIIATAGRGVIEAFSVAPDESACLLVCKATDRQTRSTESRLLRVALNSDADASTSRSVSEVALARTDNTGTRGITSAHWSSDSRRAVVAANGQLHIMSTDNWSTLRVVQPASGNCTAAQFLPETLTTGGHDLLATFDGNSALLWNLADQELLARFRGPAVVAAIAAGGPTGNEVLASGGRSLRIFSATPGSQFGRVLFRSDEFHQAPITDIASCPAAPASFVSADASGWLCLWQWDPVASKIDLQLTFNTNQHAIAEGHPTVEQPGVSVLRWAPDGGRLLVVIETGDILLYSRTPDGLLNPVPIGDGRPGPSVQLQSAAWSPDGQLIAVTGSQLESGESAGWILAVSPLAAGEQSSTTPDTTVHSYEMSVICRFAGHSSGGTSGVDFLPDSPYLVSGGRDGAVTVWNWQQPLPGDVPQAYECLRFFSADSTTAHQAAVTALQVLPDGRILSASADGTAVAWTHSLMNR